MKKLTHLITLCMVALLAYNCATDNTQDLLEEINGEISVEAYFEDLDSRTSLTDDGDGGSIVWDADDSITAIATDGTTTECKIVAMYDGHVVFRVPANTIYAVYPHLNSTSYTPSTGIITYALSSTKSLNGDDKVFVKGENPMVAKMSNNSLKFRNLCGYIQLQFTGSASVTGITLSNAANDGDALIGEYQVDMTNAESPVLNSSTLNAAMNKIAGSTNGEIALNTTTPTSFYFAVPPRTYSALKVIVKTTSGNYTITSNNSVTVNRSKIKPINTINLDNLTPTSDALDPIASGTYAGKVKLILGSRGSDVMAWSKNEKVLVNDAEYSIVVENETPIVYVNPIESREYKVVYPATIYDKTNGTFTIPFTQFYSSSGITYYPVVGFADESANVAFTTECILAKFTLKGTTSQKLRGIRLINKGTNAIAGIYTPSKIDNLSSSAVCDNGVTINCTNTTAPNSNGRAFYFVIPKGSYTSGMTVRVSDATFKYQEFSIAGFTANTGGKIVDLGTYTYSPNANILYANHFDNMTWGGDIIGGKAGLGLGSTTTDFAPADSKGTELALQRKDANTPGTSTYDTNNYNCFTNSFVQAANATSLAVNVNYLKNRGIDNWWCLYYGAEYNGYIGGSPTDHSNRGILSFPLLTAIDGRSAAVELSFDFAMQSNAGSNVILRLHECVVESLTIDGKSVDVDYKTSTIRAFGSTGSGEGGTLDHPYFYLTPKRFGDNKWHTVKIRLAVASSGSQFNFYPSVVRDVNNSFFIDNVVITKQAYKYEDAVYVEPTTELGSESDDISKMRLQVGSTGGALGVNANYIDALYKPSKNYGHTYISPGFGSVDQNDPEAFDDAHWLAVATNSKRVYDAAGVKVWCMHLPYGYQSVTSGYFDIASRTEDTRKKAVALLKRIVTAAAPLEAKYLLVHCNQYLKYPTGTLASLYLNAEITAMAKSLYELQLHAEATGVSTIVVENMSWGVGSKASELVSAVDKANAMTTSGALKRKVRIAMDTGHATASMMYANKSSNVTSKNIVEWVKTVGTRLGTTHIQGNRGANTSVASYSYSVIYDDHIYPGVEGTRASYPDGYVNDGTVQLTGGTEHYDINARNNLWGEFYKAVLKDCRYRGVFDYESSRMDVPTVKDDAGLYFKRGVHPKTLSYSIYNFDYYIYDAYRKL